MSPAPVIGPRQAALLSNRWRQQLRSLIEAHQLDPATALAELMALAGEEHRKGLYAVLTGFRGYSPEELSEDLFRLTLKKISKAFMMEGAERLVNHLHKHNVS